jgi:hypothetical protein
MSNINDIKPPPRGQKSNHQNLLGAGAKTARFRKGVSAMWILNAICVGFLALVVAVGWFWFIWNGWYALCCRRAGSSAQKTKPAALESLEKFVAHFQGDPF